MKSFGFSAHLISPAVRHAGVDDGNGILSRREDAGILSLHRIADGCGCSIFPGEDLRTADHQLIAIRIGHRHIVRTDGLGIHRPVILRLICDGKGIIPCCRYMGVRRHGDGRTAAKAQVRILISCHHSLIVTGVQQPV